MKFFVHPVDAHTVTLSARRKNLNVFHAVLLNLIRIDFSYQVFSFQLCFDRQPDKILPIRELCLILLHKIRILNNPAVFILPEDHVKNRKRDDSAFNQFPEHISRSHRWQLLHVSNQNHSGISVYPAKEGVSQLHVNHTELIGQKQGCLQRIGVHPKILIITHNSQRTVHGRRFRIAGALCHTPACFPSRCHKKDGSIINLLMNIKDYFLHCCLSGSRPSRNNTEAVTESHDNSFFLPHGKLDSQLLLSLLQQTNDICFVRLLKQQLRYGICCTFLLFISTLGIDSSSINHQLALCKHLISDCTDLFPADGFHRESMV